MRMDYSSPRWTAEILDCSMPMSFDTYSVCAYGCLYCFSWFQKSHSMKGYLERDLRSVDPGRVIGIFQHALLGQDGALPKDWAQFCPYIRNRYIMQWGGLADPLDNYEKQHGITLILLKFFDSIDYPLSISTKGTWWTQDERYMSLMAKHTHNWHVKISIVCQDASEARVIEGGVPAPDERLEAIRRLAKIGIPVTLRLRPYIIGASEDWPYLISSAHEAGANSVTTEFLCLEARADQRTRKRYEAISRVVGYDLYRFYMEHSPQHGYKRLAPELKRPIFERMSSHAHKLGMRFHVSDAAGRDFNDYPNCCGVPPEWHSQTSHFGGAIYMAKQNGQVTFQQIEPGLQELFDDMQLQRAKGYNTSNTQKRAQLLGLSTVGWFRNKWNDTQSGTGLTRGYGGVLVPDGVDERGDIVFRYNGVS